MLLAKVDKSSRELELLRAELDTTQRKLWALQKRPRLRRALNLGALLGSLGALVGSVVDGVTASAWLGAIALVVGWGLGTILALQGDIESRPQDAPAPRITGSHLG